MSKDKQRDKQNEISELCRNIHYINSGLCMERGFDIDKRIYETQKRLEELKSERAAAEAEYRREFGKLLKEDKC